MKTEISVFRYPFLLEHKKPVLQNVGISSSDKTFFGGSGEGCIMPQHTDMGRVYK